MTTKEKAKAYDEALERFKSFKERYYTRNTHFGDVIFDKNGEMQKDFEEISPQLCEDEDERIRKELIKGFKFCKKIDVGKKKGSSWAGTNLNMDEVIAWLEKQNHDGKKWITPWELNRLETLRYEAGFDAGVRSEKEKQKEQKPKQEWSEEDEKIIDTIVSVLGQYVDYKAVSGTGSGYATPRYNKEIAWLKSLRPQSKIHYWTEEEIEPIISDYLTGKEHYGGMIARLRCLKPKSSWKPSEEQMDAFCRCVDYLEESDNEDADIMAELYEQLKQL